MNLYNTLTTRRIKFREISNPIKIGVDIMLNKNFYRGLIIGLIISSIIWLLIISLIKVINTLHLF